MHVSQALVVVFYFNDPATTEIYPLSLPYALPIWLGGADAGGRAAPHADGRAKPSGRRCARSHADHQPAGQREGGARSEEHTSELQSRHYFVCRLLLAKKETSVISLVRDSFRVSVT